MRKLIHILRRLRTFLLSPLILLMDKRARTSDNLLQKILYMNYQQMKETGLTMPKLDEVGFSIYSESDEDGILHYIFSIIGITNKVLVDIGSGTIQGSNTANLIINHGWTGLLIDGNPDSVKKNIKYYSSCDSTRNYPPHLYKGFVNADNVNNILSENNITGEIDLLCIDIDGIDYWVWDAITVIQPRVVIVEYQCIWGYKKSVTVPNDPSFKPELENGFGIYSGASLNAFVKLGKSKGYRLIGSQSYGYNAFFIKNDIHNDILPEVSPESCFSHPFTKWAENNFLDKIKSKKWIKV